MANKKADNQWYGKGFEQAIVIVKKHQTPINPYPDHISAKDWLKLLHDAAVFIIQYEKQIAPIITIEWIGNKTKNEDGDLIINGIKVEVKHVEDANGTYMGTSWAKAVKKYDLPLPDSREYLKTSGCYDKLFAKFGDEVNTINASPFDIDRADEIQEKEKEWYNKYKQEEKKTREPIVEAVYQFLKDNPNKCRDFLYGILSKDINDKQAPDQLVVFNYKKQQITYFSDKTTLMNTIDNYKLTKTNRQKVGFKLGPFNIQIGWQNGAALCNPTVRALIKG